MQEPDHLIYYYIANLIFGGITYLQIKEGFRTSYLKKAETKEEVIKSDENKKVSDQKTKTTIP
jgi:hypothetical protein